MVRNIINDATQAGEEARAVSSRKISQAMMVRAVRLRRRAKEYATKAAAMEKTIVKAIKDGKQFAEGPLSAHISRRETRRPSFKDIAMFLMMEHLGLTEEEAKEWAKETTAHTPPKISEKLEISGVTEATFRRVSAAETRG